MDEQFHKKNKLVGKALVMFVIMIISKILGFSRDILLTYKFGTSEIVDAYTVALTLPSVLFAVFVSGLNQSYLPYYTRKESDKERQQLFSNTLILYFMLSLLVAFVSYGFRTQIAALLAPGFDSARRSICESFIGIVIWMLPFHAVFALMSAQLQTNEDFNAANICDFLIINVVVIISILVATLNTPRVLAIGYLLSMVAACAALGVYFIFRGGVRFQPKKENALHDFKELMVIAIPVGLSYMVNQLNSVTDSVFSSTFSTGVTSGLNYANKLQSFFLALTTTVFMTIVFPRLNKYFAQNNLRDGAYYIKKGITLSTFLSIPFAAFIGAFSREIVVSLFQRGAFDEKSTIITAGCLALYSVGIPFYSFVEIGSRTLTAALKQKLILKNTTIAVSVNILADYILMKMIGYIGLSLATSISGMLLFVLYFIDIHKMGLNCFPKEITNEIVKILVATLCATVMALIIRAILPESLSTLANTVIVAVAFGLEYFIMCFVFKVDVIKWLLNNMNFLQKKNSI